MQQTNVGSSMNIAFMLVLLIMMVAYNVKEANAKPLMLFGDVAVMASATITPLRAVSDQSIQDFLNKFISKSVEAVLMLVDFLTTMVRDAFKDGNIKRLPATPGE